MVHILSFLFHLSLTLPSLFFWGILKQMPITFVLLIFLCDYYQIQSFLLLVLPQYNFFAQQNNNSLISSNTCGLSKNIYIFLQWFVQIRIQIRSIKCILITVTYNLLKSITVPHFFSVLFCCLWKGLSAVLQNAPTLRTKMTVSWGHLNMRVYPSNFCGPIEPRGLIRFEFFLLWLELFHRWWQILCLASLKIIDLV